MNNEIERIAQHNDMSVEFVTWFFNEKKSACGEHWFLVLGAMWESWKGRSIEMDRLAAENVALNEKLDKLALWPGIEFYSSSWEFNNNDGNEAIEFMCDIETPATDRIVAGIKADGVESGIKTIITMLNHQAPGVLDAINVLSVHSFELRKGADK